MMLIGCYNDKFKRNETHTSVAYFEVLSMYVDRATEEIKCLNFAISLRYVNHTLHKHKAKAVIYIYIIFQWRDRP